MRPKTGIKLGTGEHGTKDVIDGLVGTFDKAILMMGTDSGRVHSGVELFEEVADLGVATQFSTLVE